MNIKTKVIKFGNSYGITIPVKVAKLINFNINDELIISIVDEETLKIKKNN